MPSALTTTEPAPGPRPGGRTGRSAAPRSAGAPAVATAVLLASATTDDGAPAALLPWEGGTVLGRLLEHLAGLGVEEVRVIGRAQHAEALGALLSAAPVPAVLVPSPDLPGDLRAIADAARSEPGGLVLANAELVCHREALAGLLADPRLATAILTTGSWQARPFSFRIRATRGRVVSAGSPYHSVRRPGLSFLGVLKVSPADRTALAEAAERLAALTDGGLPPGWADELETKRRNWRAYIARLRARAAGADPDALDPADPVLDPEDEAEVRRRLRAAEGDAVALALCGLVRSGVRVDLGYLRGFFWSRPLSEDGIRWAAEELGRHDEEALLLQSAVKGSDGFFTTYFVSPYSRYIARWAAHRGFTPNQITTVSLLIGLLAAAAFAAGTRTGLVAGAVLLQISFTTDCVDGQLARYTRQFSKLGAWMDSVFDRTKEFAAFAGLAIGASAQGDPAWVLAAAALSLQTVRHTLEFSYAAARHQVIGAVEHAPLEQPSDSLRGGTPQLDALADDTVEEPGGLPDPPVTASAAAPPARGDDPAMSEEAPPAVPGRRPLRRRALGLWRRLDGVPGARWVRKMIAFPIGERFAAISLTAALFSPRVTFIVMLAWGGFAFFYTLCGRFLRSVA